MTKMTATVSVKGFKALAKKIDTAEEMRVFRTELLEPAAKIGLDTTKANAPSDLRKMIGSFVSDIDPFSAKVYTPLDKYPLIMEAGRKPGGKMPPPSVLEQWARRHGITNVFVLARSIAKRGIKGRFFRRKGRVAIRKELPKLMGDVERAMEKDWGKTVSDA